MLRYAVELVPDLETIKKGLLASKPRDQLAKDLEELMTQLMLEEIYESERATEEIRVNQSYYALNSSEIPF